MDTTLHPAFRADAFDWFTFFEKERYTEAELDEAVYHANHVNSCPSACLSHDMPDISDDPYFAHYDMVFIERVKYMKQYYFAVGCYQYFEASKTGAIEALQKVENRAVIMLKNRGKL